MFSFAIFTFSWVFSAKIDCIKQLDIFGDDPWGQWKPIAHRTGIRMKICLVGSPRGAFITFIYAKIFLEGSGALLGYFWQGGFQYLLQNCTTTSPRAEVLRIHRRSGNGLQEKCAFSRPAGPKNWLPGTPIIIQIWRSTRKTLVWNRNAFQLCRAEGRRAAAPFWMRCDGQDKML